MPPFCEESEFCKTGLKSLDHYSSFPPLKLCFAINEIQIALCPEESIFLKDMVFKGLSHEIDLVFDDMYDKF